MNHFCDPRYTGWQNKTTGFSAVTTKRPVEPGRKNDDKNFQKKFWGGANQKFDVVIQRIRDFHKEQICNGEVRNIQIRVHGKDEILTAEHRGMAVTFKTRDPNSNSQKWVLVPSVTYDSNRRFKLGSQEVIGKYLTFDAKQKKFALKADCWDTWEFK